MSVALNVPSISVSLAQAGREQLLGTAIDTLPTDYTPMIPTQ
jgi:hypothetical protein